MPTIDRGARVITSTTGLVLCARLAKARSASIRSPAALRGENGACRRHRKWPLPAARLKTLDSLECRTRGPPWPPNQSRSRGTGRSQRETPPAKAAARAIILCVRRNAACERERAADEEHASRSDQSADHSRRESVGRAPGTHLFTGRWRHQRDSASQRYVTSTVLLPNGSRLSCG